MSSTTFGVTLLENASATGSDFWWAGGRGFFSAVATFGGGSVTLQYLGPDNTTWVAAQQPDATDAALTAAGGVLFDAPPGRIRAAVVTATAVYARADRVPS